MDDHYILDSLKKQFLSCTPLNKFKWPDLINDMHAENQEQIINTIVNSELILKYPIKQSYKKAFLKLFISKLEQNGIEVNDNVYNTYCKIIACPNEDSSMHYRHFVVNSEGIDLLSIKESTSIISEGTTGLCSWEAAFYLAEWCIVNKHVLNGKRILELGSGIGLAGIVIINLCAPKMYYFSDYHPKVLKTLEENVRLNLLTKKNLSWKDTSKHKKIQFEKINVNNSTQVEIINLKWEEINKSKAEELEIDLVICADVLYDDNTFDSLAHGLQKLLWKNVNYAILVATIRNESTVLKFLNTLDKYNLIYKEEITPVLKVFVQSEDSPVKVLKIWRQKKEDIIGL